MYYDDEKYWWSFDEDVVGDWMLLLLFIVVIDNAGLENLLFVKTDDDTFIFLYIFSVNI